MYNDLTWMVQQPIFTWSCAVTLKLIETMF